MEPADLVSSYSVVNDILGDKIDKVFKASVNTFRHSRVSQVAAVEETMVARRLKLLKKCLRQRRDDKLIDNYQDGIAIRSIDLRLS